MGEVDIISAEQVEVLRRPSTFVDRLRDRLQKTRKPVARGAIRIVKTAEAEDMSARVDRLQKSMEPLSMAERQAEMERIKVEDRALYDAVVRWIEDAGAEAELAMEEAMNIHDEALLLEGEIFGALDESMTETAAEIQKLLKEV